MSEEELKKELEDAQREAEEHLAGWKRAMADYQNLEKQVSAERDLFYQSAAEHLMRDLLPVLDQIDSALRHEPVLEDGAEWRDGVKMVFDGLKAIARNHGLQRMEVIGKKFDPNFHESLGARKDESAEQGTILEEARAGYMLHGKVLRPAQVIISDGVAKANQAN